MTSMSGYVTYVNYVAGSNKGQTSQGDIFNNPFALGDFDKDGNPKDFDADYTSMAVVETAAVAGAVTPAWQPVVKESFVDESGNKFDVKVLNADGSFKNYANLDSEGKISMLAGEKLAYK